MCMTVNDGREAGRFRVEIEIVKVVEYVELQPPCGNDCHQRQRRGPHAAVNIAANSQGRRDGSELFEHPGFANIACMNDEV